MVKWKKISQMCENKKLQRQRGISRNQFFFNELSWRDITRFMLLNALRLSL